MRRLAIVSLLTAPACFTEAPGLDEAQEGSSSESDSGGLEESEGGSSSSGEPVDPLDAYGPCEVDADCPLIPGDEGEVGESPRCVEGTCAIRCAQAAHSNQVCPGYDTYKSPPGTQYPSYPILCGSDGYCTIVDSLDLNDPGPCPDGMLNDGHETIPELACMWEP